MTKKAITTNKKKLDQASSKDNSHLEEKPQIKKIKKKKNLSKHHQQLLIGT